MIGRDETVTALISRLSRQRLVTILGPGGIGKTTLALDLAERMIESYEHGVWLVDLAPLGDPRLVPSAVATVLGLEIRTEDLLRGLVAGLKDKRMLLLLDNCEHVIDAVASLAVTVLSGAPGRWSSRFAGGLTACRWRSSSRHLASKCLGLKALPPAWMTA